MLRWAVIYLEAEIEEVILEDAQNISLAEYLVTVAAAICKVFPSQMIIRIIRGVYCEETY